MAKLTRQEEKELEQTKESIDVGFRYINVIKELKKEKFIEIGYRSNISSPSIKELQELVRLKVEYNLLNIVETELLARLDLEIDEARRNTK